MEHLGWVLNSRYDVDRMIMLSEKHGFNPSGEGGEYETYVLDAPIFKKKIVVDKFSKEWHGDSGYLIIENAYLV
jgi:diphthamide synthase (EF-2-diphthine--ammonia ligase)